MKKNILMLLWGLLIGSPLPAVTIGLYTGTGSYGAQGLEKTIATWPEFQCQKISDLTAPNLQGIDLLIISHNYNFRARDAVRQAVIKQGIGVLLTHDAAGSGRRVFCASAAGTFPELAAPPPETEGSMVSTRMFQKVKKNHPILRGVPTKFTTSYSDHSALYPTAQGEVLIEDCPRRHPWSHRTFPGTQVRWNRFAGGNAVLVAGQVGRGRVVLYGGMPGFSTRNQEAPVAGGEKILLKNIIKYLSSPVSTHSVAQFDNSRYQFKGEIAQVKLVPHAIKLLTPPTTSPQATAKREIQVELQFAQLHQAQLATLNLTPELGRPCGVKIDRQIYPLSIVNNQASFLYLPLQKSVKATLLYSAVAPAIQVRLAPDKAWAEITTPHLKMIVAVENNLPCIEFLSLYDPTYHHTWYGLERQQYSAPLLRLSPQLWPFQKLPPSILHERAYLPPWEISAAGERHNFNTSVKLQVGKGEIEFWANGQFKLTGFAATGRLATWALNQYENTEQIYPENMAPDLPVFQGKIIAGKKHLYALGGSFKLTGELGVTGMSPGVMRQFIIPQAHSQLWFATTDWPNRHCYWQWPQTSAVPIKPLAASEKSTAAVTLPVVQLNFNKLYKNPDRLEFFPVLPRPVDVFKDQCPQEVVTWHSADLALHSAISTPGKPQLPMAALQLTPEAQNDDTDLRCRLWLSQKNFKLGHHKTQIIGRNAAGEVCVILPLEYSGYVGIPTGVYTYDSQWIQQRQYPKAQWSKVIRSAAMTNLDYIIHTANNTRAIENSAQIYERAKNYGLRIVADTCGIPRHYSRNLGSFAPFKFKPQTDAMLKRCFDTFGRDPAILAWHLTDEAPVGRNLTPQKLTAGYKIANHMYELGQKYLPAGTLKYNLITTGFTDLKSWTTCLKTDIYSHDPYYAGYQYLNQDLLRNKVPADKPRWVTIRGVGPTWYDCTDLYWDIRRQFLTAWLHGCDSINCFMFSHWYRNLEKNAWYTVFPGARGPVGTPRRQVLEQVAHDLKMLGTAEYLLKIKKPTPRQIYEFNMIKAALRHGRVFQMHQRLNALLQKLNWDQVVVK